MLERGLSALGGKADALVREGCYDCLKEALDIYGRHLNYPQRRSARLYQGYFDAALLIAIRTKELGIYSTGYGPMDLARSASNMLPPPIPPAVPWTVLLEAADLVIGETSGMDPEQRAQLVGRSRPALDPDDPKRRALDA